MLIKGNTVWVRDIPIDAFEQESSKRENRLFTFHCEFNEFIKRPGNTHRILSAVQMIENELGEILLLQRHITDRVYPSIKCFPGGKIDPKDLKQNPLLSAIIYGAWRGAREETKLSTSTHKLIGAYNCNSYRIYVIKPSSYSGTMKKFPSKEHESAHRIKPEDAIKDGSVGNITKKIIAEYYDLSQYSTTTPPTDANI